MQNIEYGPSGPTAVKDIDPAGLGLSAAGAAFIAANCSPFTNPRDMPEPAKVPDPRNTQNTESMFVWGHFDIASVVDPMGYNSQIIASNPDFLAPLPVTWMTGSGDVAATRMSPDVHARLYEMAGLHDLVHMQHELGRRAKSYRIVGHGLKVWPSKNSTVSRGNIEAGQFSFENARNFTKTSPNSYVGLPFWSNAPGTDASLGAQAMFMQTRDVQAWRTMLGGCKEQEIGFLAADEGATIRWTDSNDFRFNPAVNRAIIFPHEMTYGPSGYKAQSIGYSNSDGTPQVNANNAFAFNGTPSALGLIGVATTFYGDINRLGTTKRISGGTSNVGFYTTATGESTATVRAFKMIGGNTITGVETNDQSVISYCQNPDLQFNKGLFADISGLDAGQTMTVQVCWHIEYVPNGQEPWGGDQSPVDMQYEQLAAICRNRLAFPIVVKGHSFFSSLKKAFGKAVGAIGKIFQTGMPIAQGLLSSIPDPRAQAAALGLGTVSSIYSAFKRPRTEE